MLPFKFTRLHISNKVLAYQQVMHYHNYVTVAIAIQRLEISIKHDFLSSAYLPY